MYWFDESLSNVRLNEFMSYSSVSMQNNEDLISATVFDEKLPYLH